MNISEFNAPRRVHQHLEDITQSMGKKARAHIQIIASAAYSKAHDDVPCIEWTLYIHFRNHGRFKSLQDLIDYLENWIAHRPYREILFRRFSIPSKRYDYRLAAQGGGHG